jgi:CubicO group peptidase (beta-lactamase class C family)
MVKKFFLILLVCVLAAPSGAAKKSSKKSDRSTSSKKSKKKKKKVSFDNFIKKAQELDTGSLIIIQDGKFLVENNWQSPLTFYYMQGITPSLVTLALGPSIDEGKISLDSAVTQWIPDWIDNRAEIKVNQLLTQTSGFADDEKDPWYKNPDTWAWLRTQTPKTDPGTSFNISDTNSLLLGFVIAKATDSDPESLIKKKLLTPLKIQKWSWDKDKFGHFNTAGGLRLRNYDLLKIGNLIAQNGEWNDQKIISESWLEQIQKPSEKSPTFGLNWWLQEEHEIKAVFAFGYQGQFLVVIPEKKIVAIRLRTLVPVEQNKPEYDWSDFPKELLDLSRRL